MAVDSLLLRPLSPQLRLLSPTASSRGFCSQLQYHKKCNTIDKSWKETVAGCHTNKHMGLRIERFTRSNGWRHLNATSEHSLEPEPEAYTFMKLWNILLSSLNVFYRFSRPHTVIGTALSIVSVSVLSIEKFADFSQPFFTGLLQALISALFMNIYIVGLNQLFDIEIDKVNKPTLPLASGEYSFRTGAAIVSVFAIMSFGIGWVVGSWPLLWALFVSFILGTAYSINLPFFRWKRFAVLAAMCILAVRAVIVQLAFFLHIQTFVFRRPASFSKPLIFATAFMTFFSIVIALFKDIPDVEGDRIFGIRSFSVRLGQKPVFWTCVCLLEMAYAVAIVAGATSTCLWSKFPTVLGHAVLALILWNNARSVSLTSKAAITSFYMLIWKLFYAEYLLIPLIR
ncbi:probable homogentisate phytyltransferase 1, chloroplastic isoform X1 [Dendrobium catenatum]|uniref:Putative homogentisate phytyltransferase 1, chloroplastic n=1 Tax=Dendrobium catenatum TaxID=906689 RepID=A0A2I0W8E8_9ASPA|nr:probable homogentisate phytyltransferase 1, chloroplastic isoform X1 [Dendrobium catenatum]XP_028553836.1 probable homogentisate phytyltransferase 1, chloroplastic isoform X1 [Dendrobium catenatum]PKU71948.1 putative homogentisate phytyltransferase 1, chloroplastic [Dendrobium catenatum]